MCVKVVSKNPKMLKYYPDKCKLKKCVIKLLMLVCHHLNLFPISLLWVNCLKYLIICIFWDNIDLDYIDSDIVSFFSEDLEINTTNLNNINLDNNLKSMIQGNVVAKCKEYKQRNASKKVRKESMLVAKHPTKWWDWCMSEYKKGQFFIN